MSTILASISCSTFIILLFKFLGRRGVETFPVIAANYVVCVFVGSYFFTSETSLSPSELPSFLLAQAWLPLAVVLGFFFIFSFQLMALCTRERGVTVTAVAHKLSMVIPIVFAFIVYLDQLNGLKLAGILLAIPAILLSAASKRNQELAINDKEEQPDTRKSLLVRSALLLPFFVWLIGGCTDILINYSQRFYLESKDFPFFLTVIFGIAGILAFAWILLAIARNKQSCPGPSTMLWGILLGIPNFGSTYFFLSALENSGLEASSVFPLINIGVVAAAAFSAWLIFKERFEAYHLGGLFLSFLVIILISLGSQ